MLETADMLFKMMDYVRQQFEMLMTKKTMGPPEVLELSKPAEDQAVSRDLSTAIV